jgi:hypothetical protein
MTLEQWAAIAEIVSSAAIVATLVYLAIQAQQAKDMLLGNSRQAVIATDVTLLTNVFNNPDPAARILRMDSKQVEHQSLLILFVRSREYQWFQYQKGTLDRETFESYMSPLKAWLGDGLGAAFWSTNQRSFDQEFVEFVNGRLKA